MPVNIQPLPSSSSQGIDQIDQLRETVETQARVIRYLLANYDALLKKVEREEGNGGGGP